MGARIIAILREKFYDISKYYDMLYEKLRDTWEDRIKSGSIAPPLKEATIKFKEKMGFPGTTEPLFSTGNLAEGFKARLEDNKIIFYAESDVSYGWHNGRANAAQVPRRVVFELEELKSLIHEILASGRAQ